MQTTGVHQLKRASLEVPRLTLARPLHRKYSVRRRYTYVGLLATGYFAIALTALAAERRNESACATDTNISADQTIDGCTKYLQDRADRSNEQTAVAYVIRGQGYSLKNDLDRAIADFDKAIELNPKSSDGFRFRGLAHFSKQDYERALTDFNSAILLRPNYRSAYYNRALVFLAKEDLTQAGADLDEAARIGPRTSNIIFLRATVYKNQKDWKHAIELFGGVIDDKAAVNRNIALVERGLAYMKLGQEFRAIGDFDRVVREFSSFGYGYYARASFYEERGDLARAMEDCGMGIRYNPGLRDENKRCSRLIEKHR